MTAIFDLHPDDHTARAALRDRLRHEREQRGFTVDEFAAATATSRGVVYNRESAKMASYRLDSLTIWANQLGQSFTIVATDVPGYHDNPIAAALECCGADAFQHAAEIDRLIAARTARLTSGRMASRLGTTQSAVSTVENRDTVTALLITWQRYARALGGRLALVLTDGVTGREWSA